MPLWVRMLRDNVGLEIWNLESVPMPVDVHIARATGAWLAYLPPRASRSLFRSLQPAQPGPHCEGYFMANKCKGVVMSRLRIIEEQTGPKPEQLRRLSGHFAWMETEFADSRVAGICRRGLVQENEEVDIQA